MVWVSFTCLSELATKILGRHIIQDFEHHYSFVLGAADI